jgi:hypothetical protein
MREGEIIKAMDGKEYLCVGENRFSEIAGYRDGTPILRMESNERIEGFDTEGNPKRSVNIKVKCVRLDMKPGDNG